MRKRRWLLPGCLAFWLLVTPLVGFVVVGMQTTGGMGDMQTAVKLRPAVEILPAPNQPFMDRKANVVGLYFPTGEWVVGVAKDSHAWFSTYTGGGTAVLKDSRGRVRCFFGHVCGDGNLALANGAKSLDEFDAMIVNYFTEQPWP
jgi:hypothetical protein